MWKVGEWGRVQWVEAVRKVMGCSWVRGEEVRRGEWVQRKKKLL